MKVTVSSFYTHCVCCLKKTNIYLYLKRVNSQKYLFIYSEYQVIIGFLVPPCHVDALALRLHIISVHIISFNAHKSTVPSQVGTDEEDTQKVKKFNRIFRKLFSMPFFLELEIPPLTTTHALLVKNYVTASSKKFQVFYMSSYPIPFTTIIFWSFRDFSWNTHTHTHTHTHTCVCVLSRFSRIWLCATLWTIACQVPLSMGFSSQEYWSGLSCLPPEDLPNPGIKPVSLMSPALADRLFTTRATWEAYTRVHTHTHTLVGLSKTAIQNRFVFHFFFQYHLPTYNIVPK